MMLALQVYVAAYRKLPLVLAGTGHTNNDKGRTGLISTFEQWVNLSHDERAAAHPITKLFCCPTSVVHQQAVEFLSPSSSLQDFPDLFYHATRLALIPLLEISIEAKHAKLHQEFNRGPNVGAASSSLAHRLAPAVDLISNNPQYWEGLAATCSKVYHPVDNLMTTGIAGHPDFTSVLADVRLQLPDGSVEFALGSTMKYAKRVACKK